MEKSNLLFPQPATNELALDVPGDHSCLFWAVALAYLLPAKNDTVLFEQRFIRLFGEQATAFMPHALDCLQQYHPDQAMPLCFADKLVNQLVRATFRQRVIAYIADHKETFKDYYFERYKGDNFDNYLATMQDPSTWGGELEIRAMSELLACGIEVHTDNASYPFTSPEYTVLLAIKHVNVEGNENGEKNHYHFMVNNAIFNFKPDKIKPANLPTTFEHALITDNKRIRAHNSNIIKEKAKHPKVTLKASQQNHPQFVELLDAYYKPLKHYAQSGDYNKDGLLQEPLWLYRLQAIEKQQIIPQLNACYKNLNTVADKDFALLLNLTYQTHVTANNKKPYDFSALCIDEKCQLLEIATHQNNPKASYAVSLLITLWLRCEKELALRQAAVRLLQGRSVILQKNQQAFMVVDKKQDETSYKIRDFAFKDLLNSPFVNFSYAIFAQLKIPNTIIFSGHYLYGVNAHKVNLQSATLRYSCLEKAHLTYANLRQVEAEGINLAGANLSNADLSEGIFKKGFFADAKLRHVTAKKTHFTQAIFCQADLTAINLAKAHLSGVQKLTGEQLLPASSLQGCTLDTSAFTVEELHRLTDKGAMNVNVPQVADNNVTPLVRMFRDKEGFEYSEVSPNWPAPIDKGWQHTREWNSVSDPQQTLYSLSSDHTLYLLVKHLIKKTGDNETYQSQRFEFARLKKALDSSWTEFGNFIQQEVQQPPTHTGQQESICLQQIQVLHNPDLWKIYRARKKALLAQLQQKQMSKPLQNAQVKWHGENELHGLPVIDEKAGECWLFHGTSQKTMKLITQGGFSTKFATKKPLVGYGALGKGIYLSDNFAKVATYITCPKCENNQCLCPGAQKPWKAVFLTRVLLGNIYIDKHKNRKDAEALPEGYHSAWGPAKKFADDSQFDCNEFIVTDSEQIYPEFCIFYTDNEPHLDYKKLKDQTLLPLPSDHPEFPNLKQRLQRYYRILAFGHLEQRELELHALHETLTELMRTKLADTVLAKLKWFSHTLQEEIKYIQETYQALTTFSVPFSLPLFEIQTHYYFHTAQWAPLIGVLEANLTRVQIHHSHRYRQGLLQRAVAYHQLHQTQDCIKHLHQAWCEDETLTLDTLKHCAYLTLTDYYTLSLKLLKQAYQQPYQHEAWVRRISLWYVNKLLAGELSLATWEENYEQLHPANKATFLQAAYEAAQASIKVSAQQRYRKDYLSHHPNETRWQPALTPAQQHAWSTPQQRYLLEFLSHLPNEMGERPATKLKQQLWDQTLKQLTTTRRTSVEISWLAPTQEAQQPYQLQQYYLPQRYIDQLFHAESGYPNVAGKQAQGRALVKLLKTAQGEPLAFIKFYPNYPLRQQAVDSLCQRLSGYSAQTTLAKLKVAITLANGQVAERSYPVLLSQPLGQVKAQTATLLHYQLKGQDKAIEEGLEAHAFTWKYLETAIISPKDDKNDNLAVIPLEGRESQYRLVSLDTDEGLVNDPAAADNLYLYSNVFLLTQAFAKKSWDKQALAAYGQLNIPSLLNAWLDELKQRTHQLVGNEAKQYLFTPDELKGYARLAERQTYETADKTLAYSIACHLDKLFSNEDLVKLCERMQRLQWLLQSHEDSAPSSAQAFLAHWDVQLAYHYQKAYDAALWASSSIRFQQLPKVREHFHNDKVVMSLGPQQRLTAISISRSQLPAAKNLAARFMTKVLPSQVNSLLSYSALHPQAQLLASFLSFYQRFTEVFMAVQQGDVTLFGQPTTPNFIRERVLKALRWEALPPGAATQLIESLQGLTIQYLRIENTQDLNETVLINTLKKLPKLTTLTLSACLSLSFTFLQALANCKGLTKFTLSNMRFDKSTIKETPLSLPQVRALTLKRVLGIERLAITAPFLMDLVIERSSLKEVKVNGVLIEVNLLQKAKTLTLKDIRAALVEGNADYLNALINPEGKRAVLEGLPFIKITSQPLQLYLLTLLKAVQVKEVNLASCNWLEDAHLTDLVKALPHLKHLNVADCKKLTGDTLINLLNTYCPELEYLEVSGSAIKTLSNPNIVSDSYLHKANLQQIIAKGCHNLKTIKLQTPFLYEMDVSNATALVEVEIHCEQQQGRLLVKGCANLPFKKYLQASWGWSLLKWRLQDWKIGQELGMLDKLKETYGTQLNLYLGNIGAKGALTIARILPKNIILTLLALRTNWIGDAGAKAMATALEKNTTLTQLDLGHNKIGAEGAKAMATALEKNTTLTQLDLGHNKIGAEGAKAMATALEKNTTLTQLDLRVNQIGDEGAKAIATALEKNTTLTQLYLGSLLNKIGDEGAKAMATALEKNTTLTQLDLRTNGIGDEGAKAMATALEKNTTLTQLYLSLNEIGPEGAKAIATALAKNTTLTQLDLSSNEIGAEGRHAEAVINDYLLRNEKRLTEMKHADICLMAMALVKNTTLTQLDLRVNQIGDEGAKALATALEKNTILTQLDLRVNQIGHQGATALATALEKNTTLTELTLKHNRIGPEGATALATALAKNITLTKLNLSNNGIGAGTEGNKAISTIATALEKNTTLTVLDLSGNKIGAKGATTIATALKKNTTLIQLKLSDNKIWAEGAQALATALVKNTTLTRLDLKYIQIGDGGAEGEYATEVIKKYLQRNENLLINMENAAIRLLVLARYILLGKIGPKTSNCSVFEVPELILQIFWHFAGTHVLTREQCRQVMHYAQTKTTLGQTKGEFLRQTGCHRLGFFQPQSMVAQNPLPANSSNSQAFTP